MAEGLCSNFKTITILIMILSLTAQVAAQNKLKPADEAAVRKIEETYRTAWVRNDEKTILDLFTDDATLYPNGNPMVKGKTAMKQFWFAPSDTVTTINKYETNVEEVYGEKKLAYLTGTNEIHWSMAKKDGSEMKRYISKGYFIAVYVKKGKEWKIFRQSWGSKTQEIK